MLHAFSKVPPLQSNFYDTVECGSRGDVQTLHAFLESSLSYNISHFPTEVLKVDAEYGIAEQHALKRSNLLSEKALSEHHHIVVPWMLSRNVSIACLLDNCDVCG